jgi:hypothetical protein
MNQTALPLSADPPGQTIEDDDLANVASKKCWPACAACGALVGVGGADIDHREKSLPQGQRR